MSVLRRGPGPDPEQALLLRHPDLTDEQVEYARTHLGDLWRFRYRPTSPVQVLLTVLLPEIDEPKILTRQRLVQGVVRARAMHRAKISSASVAIWVEHCWNDDLLIIEHGLQHRHYGIVLA